jgi:cystathionine beta-lyase/cystathionine gamma-synthase
VEPIVQSANFMLNPDVVADLKSTGGRGSYSYTRVGNPTIEAAARVIAALEGAQGAVVVASGMAAITAAVTALLPPGGRLVAAEELYGDAAHLFDQHFARTGYQVARLPLATLCAGDDAALGPADVVYVETLSSPMLRVADIEQITGLAHRAGARLVVDDTFTTPVNCKPLALGADLVLCSATKYLNGHSDVVAGAVAGPAELVEQVRDLVTITGGTADPMAAYLLLRGLKTLPIRMARHNQTALWLAEQLSERPELELVAYPMLASHPDHVLAARLLGGGAGIVTIRVAGGDAAVHRVQDRLRLIQPATSLGAIESLACIPAETSHLTVSEAERIRLGILPGTLRLSIGLEEPADLLHDLVQALTAAETAEAGAAAPAAR